MDEQAVEAKQGVEASNAASLAQKIVANLRRVIHAPDETLEFSVLCLLSEGHLIIEDFPGVGKTTLARELASLGVPHLVLSKGGDWLRSFAAFVGRRRR